MAAQKKDSNSCESGGGRSRESLLPERGRQVSMANLGDVMQMTSTMSSTEDLKNFAKREARNLFVNVKFLNPEDIACDGIVSRKIRKAMGYKKDAWRRLWEDTFKKIVRDTISDKRNSFGAEDFYERYGQCHCFLNQNVMMC